MSLLQHTLKMPNLRRAWVEVSANDGAAGVDHETIAVWARNWEARLAALAADVRAGLYRPGELRELLVPKASGDGLRLLRIPTITDRVLQRAVLQVLHPIVEPQFLPCSYGYRPGRGVPDAVRAITHLRRQGYTWVIDADIDDFFHQVDHELLASFLDEDLPDDSLIALIMRWNKTDCLTPTCDRGIPMGSPLSPLLANVYLHRLDQAVTAAGFPLVRYADDFIVLAAWPDGRAAAYERVGRALAALKLRYEPRKTRLASFDDGFDFLGVHFEETWYWYLYDDKRIEVRSEGDEWQLERFRPEYEGGRREEGGRRREEG
jgi:group II intron reverse transcriptase/maturase